MTGTAGGRLFHLVTADVWAATAPAGRPEQPFAHDQLDRHGFVHCCFREQLTEIASWWFDPDDELVALELDPEQLRGEVRLERAPRRWYPHLYGPIDAAAVVRAHLVPRDVDGVAVIPPALRQPPPAFRLHGRVRPSGPEVIVRWSPGRLEGDPEWVQAATAAANEGRLVPLADDVVVPPDLHRPSGAFGVLDLVAAELTGYDGDGFF